MPDLLNRKTRAWLYGISLTAVPILVAYGAINQTEAPLWVALFGSILSPSLALTHLTPDTKDQP